MPPPLPGGEDVQNRSSLATNHPGEKQFTASNFFPFRLWLLLHDGSIEATVVIDDGSGINI